MSASHSVHAVALGSVEYDPGAQGAQADAAPKKKPALHAHSRTDAAPANSVAEPAGHRRQPVVAAAVGGA